MMKYKYAVLYSILGTFSCIHSIKAMEREWPIESSQFVKNVGQGIPQLLYNNSLFFSAIGCSLLLRQIDRHRLPGGRLDHLMGMSSKVPLAFTALTLSSGTVTLKCLAHPLLVYNKTPHSHEGLFMKYNFLNQDKCIEEKKK